MTYLPTASELAPIVVKILKQLGGRSHFKDLDKSVAQHLKLDQTAQSLIRSGKRTEFAYRMSWARTACKNRGEIRNAGKGIWEVN